MTRILIECTLNPKKVFISLCSEIIYIFQMFPILELFLPIQFLYVKLIPTMRIILFQRTLLPRERAYCLQFNDFFSRFVHLKLGGRTKNVQGETANISSPLRKKNTIQVRQLEMLSQLELFAVFTYFVIIIGFRTGNSNVVNLQEYIIQN